VHIDALIKRYFTLIVCFFLAIGWAGYGIKWYRSAPAKPNDLGADAGTATGATKAGSNVAATTFDAVTCLDVIEHIVTEDAFGAAMGNIAKAVADDGVFVLGPVLERHGRHLYYVHFWTEDDARAALPGWQVVDAVPFRSGRLLLLRRGA
jgi:hypothetical protein